MLKETFHLLNENFIISSKEQILFTNVNKNYSTPKIVCLVKSIKIEYYAKQEEVILEIKVVVCIFFRNTFCVILHVFLCASRYIINFLLLKNM